ncbi:hypothetical protein PV327_000406 [Microctonus hyperodae]|uniref:Lariat debranching enzyme C-terminal domain-containing protein n=1 Tax=Microctonus hyperodae TaxID=165561 RepID=A0AA39G6E8_MICHY|nr:hypothetical protein PV327_000406 [Microctonus hyperodae]
MKIAIEGCAHGELEIIYNTILEIEKNSGNKIDLLICCGDFQSTRNNVDLSCMAVPDKYKNMCSFYKYYSGEKTAPVLTIFIGGNHEASNYLQELPYGGWVAPNIYYMGYANVITIGGIRIAGISGIYNSHHLLRGHFEQPPYNTSSMRSVYHIRNLEIFRLKQLSEKIDIFLSHDWPRGISKYGNERELLRRKSFLKDDIDSDSLGNPQCMELLKQHYPTYWFAAHLHCKFAAIVPKNDETKSVTKFLALDKCLPRRKFLQVIDVPHDENIPLELSYDLEWLTILYLTNHLLSVKNSVNYMPGEGGVGRWNYTPTRIEKDNVLKKFNNTLEVPKNFVITAEPFNPQSSQDDTGEVKVYVNKQTTEFCDKLGIDDPAILLQIMSGSYRENKLNDSMNESCSQESELNSESLEMSATFDDESILGESLDEIALKSPVIKPQISESETAESQENTNLSLESNTKIFKRRNYSIYNNTV